MPAVQSTLRGTLRRSGRGHCEAPLPELSLADVPFDKKKLSDSERIHYARLISAEFMKRDAANIKYPWFFSVRGNCLKGLLRRMGLTPRMYSAWLLAIDGVYVKGRDTVCVRADAWKDGFIGKAEYGLRGPPDEPNMGPCEFTKSKILLEALKEHGSKTIDRNGPTSDQYLIRIGEYGSEGAIDPATEINKGNPPPQFDHKQRTLHRWFMMNAKDFLAPFLKDKRLPLIEKWVCMEELKENPPPCPTSPQKSSKKISAPTPSPSANPAAVTPSPLKTPEDDSDDEDEDWSGSDDDSDDDSFGGGWFEEDDDDEGKSDPMAKKFPMLAKFDLPLFAAPNESPVGFNVASANRENLLREIVQLRQKYNEPLLFDSNNSRSVSMLLDVPFCKSKGDLSANLDKWMETMLGAGIGTTSDIVHAMLQYLNNNCKEELQQELSRMGFIPKVMDEYDVAALMEYSNIQLAEWRKVVQCLKMFMGIETICVPERKWRELGKGHGAVHTDFYEYEKEEGKRKEKMHYWWKDPVDEFLRIICHLVNANKLDPSNISFINVGKGGDHGKEKFRFTTKLIVRMEDGEYYEYIYPIGDVKCAKDNGLILKETILPKIEAGVNRIASEKATFYKKDGEWHCTFDAVDDTEHPTAVEVDPNCFIAGDLAFLCCITGKEGYEKDWCYICDLFHKAWQDTDHTRGIEWTLATLAARVLHNEAKKLTGTARGGVKEAVFFSKVPVRNIIFSVLHAMMGIGNAGLKLIIDFIELHVENLPQEEIGMRNELRFIEQLLAEARHARDSWKKTEDGKRLGSCQNMIKYREKKIARGGINSDKMEEYVRDIAQYKAELVVLEATLAAYVEEVDGLVEEQREVLKKVKKFRTDRKVEDESLYSEVDKILQSYKIIRSAYHSGEVNGVGIKLLMENAEAIMDKICIMCLEKCRPGGTSPDQIKKFCNDCKIFFTLWDDAFAAVHVVDPVEADFVYAQNVIDQAMAHTRSMNMSITPKAHGMEDHVVKQMRSTPGGIAKLVEHWVEKYHQVGYKYDMKWRRMKSEQQKALCRAHRQHIAMNPEVAKRLGALVLKYTKGKRKATLEKEEAAKRVKVERRGKASAVSMMLQMSQADNAFATQSDAPQTMDVSEEEVQMLLTLRSLRSQEYEEEEGTSSLI